MFDFSAKINILIYFLHIFSSFLNFFPSLFLEDEELIFLMAHDTDSFNKWDAGNRYYTRLILSLAEGSANIDQCVVPDSFIDAIRIILQSSGVIFKYPFDIIIDRNCLFIFNL